MKERQNYCNNKNIDGETSITIKTPITRMEHNKTRTQVLELGPQDLKSSSSLYSLSFLVITLGGGGIFFFKLLLLVWAGANYWENIEIYSSSPRS